MFEYEMSNTFMITFLVGLRSTHICTDCKINKTESANSQLQWLSKHNWIYDYIVLL